MQPITLFVSIRKAALKHEVSRISNLQNRLVMDDPPQQCTDKRVTCPGRVDLLDGEGVDDSVEILTSKRDRCSNLQISLV